MIKLMVGPSGWVRVFTMIVFGAAIALVMTPPNAHSQRKAEDDSSVLHDYRGIQLGMLADEVR